MTKARHEIDEHNDKNNNRGGRSGTKTNERKNDSLTHEYELTVSMHSKQIMWILALSLDKMVHFHGMQITHPTEQL